LGGRMIVDALRLLEQGLLPATPQPQSGVTYAAKIAKDEAALDFNLPAVVLDRRIRAFNPFPGALAHLDGVALKIWRARPVAGAGQPGVILSADAHGVTVACGEGALLLCELQKPGGKRLPAEQFLQGFALLAGQRLT
jgi:methionyl-tRNA formyltransferase